VPRGGAWWRAAGYCPKWQHHLDFDLVKRTIDVELSDEQIASRQAAWKPPKSKLPESHSGVLSKYAQTGVGMAHTGGVVGTK
jgi:dihydroxyacid dehydratase/phosphogluconate dehydratase